MKVQRGTPQDFQDEDEELEMRRRTINAAPKLPRRCKTWNEEEMQRKKKKLPQQIQLHQRKSC